MSEVMKSCLATSALLALAFGLAIAESRAQSAPLDRELCVEKRALPGFVPAGLTTRAAPEFPEAELNEESEGWVRLTFTVDPEGETKDIAVLDQVGASAMAKAARLAVARWRYKAATQDGRAVEQYGNTAEILFRGRNVGNTGIHDEFVAKFDEGRNLGKEAKYAEAITVLTQTFEYPLTLYEQAKVSFALAYAYEKLNDTARALSHVRHALIEGGSFLEKGVVPAAQRLRLRLEVANGNYRYAACAPTLPASDKFDPGGADRAATMKIIEDALKKLADTKPLSVDATLVAKPAGDEGGVWEHPLSRSRFKFGRFTGRADELRLTCLRQLTQDAPNETQQWSAPRSAGPCVLRVYGDVGATFKLIEEW